jgi:hypothetical protein
LWAQLVLVTKLLLILFALGAFANSLTAQSEPPLLIDSHTATPGR